MELKRSRGAPARGPFTSKKIPFSTRLTEETNTLLIAAAARDEVSVSQKAELLILQGLRAEDRFESKFTPIWEAFRAHCVGLLAKEGSTASPLAKTGQQALNGLISGLAEDLKIVAQQLTQRATAIEVRPTDDGAEKSRGRQIDIS